MSSPLIERLLSELGYPEITEDNHEEFVRGSSVGVLFFAGDPKKFRETNDVAVILPELMNAYSRRFRPGVVARSSELGLQMHYGFNTWPALVFVRSGGYLGAITGVQTWADYLSQIEALLTKKPGKPPGFKVPVVADS